MGATERGMCREERETMYLRGGGGGCIKKSIVRREERLCVSEGGGVYMRKSIVRWNIKCVSRWVLVALSSDIDFTRSVERKKRGGGILFIQYNGEFTQSSPFKWRKICVYIYTVQSGLFF